jgi:hypothetical protein
MHRFTWDLRCAGPWQSEKRPEGPNGPRAVPGKYLVKLTAGAYTSTKPLEVMEDPRATKAGVTTADLKEQFELNLRIRELVSEVNRLVAKVKAAQATLKDTDRLAKLNEFAARLITPPIRYSKPELQTQITYLYSLTTGADQKIGQDAFDRFAVLRKQLTKQQTDLAAILGS